MLHGVLSLDPSVALITLPHPLRLSKGKPLPLVQTQHINMGTVHVIPERDTVYGFSAIACYCRADDLRSVIR